VNVFSLDVLRYKKMCTLRLVYSCWKYKQQPSRVGAAASLGNTGCFINGKENLGKIVKEMAFDLFTLQPHLVIQGVSYKVKRI
jgi:hypothetical protein